MRAFLLPLCMATLSVAGVARADAVLPPAVQQEALLLVRYTLLALDQANKSGNYAVLRDLGAPKFRDANSVARLAAIFAAHRLAGLNLAAASVLEPVWTAPPSRGDDGALHLAGLFPSDRLQTQFDLRFEPVGGGWRLSRLAVTTQPVSQPIASVQGEALELRR